VNPMVEEHQGMCFADIGRELGKEMDGYEEEDSSKPRRMHSMATFLFF